MTEKQNNNRMEVKAQKSKNAEMDELTGELQREVERPGTNRESLERWLIEKKGFTGADAGALARAICRKLVGGRFPAIAEMELMLTEDCNQRCDYCFVEGKNRFNRMPWKVARKAVDVLFKESRDKPEVKVLYFGGEPMLEFDLIKKITLYAEAGGKKTGKKVKFDMTTNGTLFDEERTAFLARHGIKFLLSIDGDRRTHDLHRRSLDGESSYEKITRNLPLMKKYQPWLGARMTAQPDTVGRIYDNVLHLARRGINQFLIGPATGIDWTDEELDIYRDEMIRVIHWLKDQLAAGRHFRVSTLEENFETMRGRRHIWGCRAGRQSVTVTARGEIYPCSKMLGAEGLKGIFRLGNLDEGITGIYRRLVLCGMVPVEREKCEKCRYADYCMGGCYATNYQATGSVFEPDPMECRLKERTTAIIREADKIFGPEFFKKLFNHSVPHPNRTGR